MGAFPQIMQVYGIEEELDISLSMENPNVSFGPSPGTDIRLDCTIKMGIKRHGNLNYLVYDELKVRTEFNIEINSEVLFANFATLDVTPTDPSRTKPIFTTLGIDEDAYSDFWSQIDLRADEWLDYLNLEVFRTGVPLPYWKLSFLTKLAFHPGSMNAIVGLYYH
jgi:hypothetical protein